MRKGILCVTLLLLLYSCAKRSTPEGGEKDEIPPKVLSSKPENSSINFDEKKIRITFDEYIKLEKLNSQLVVSPPIDKSNYSIFHKGAHQNILILKSMNHFLIQQLLFSILEKA